MSARRLQPLNPEQHRLMQHIADFICQVVNILSRTIHEHSLLGNFSPEEIEALHLFLNDYKKQLKINR